MADDTGRVEVAVNDAEGSPTLVGDNLRDGPQRRKRLKRANGVHAAQPVTVAVAVPPGQRRAPFSFELAFAPSDMAPVVGATAVLRARLRHAHSMPITLSPGVSGAFNVGLRVYRNGPESVTFEDRMVPQRGIIPPGEWSDLSVRIPLRAFDEQGAARVTIDMLKEGEFWFSPPDQPAVDTVVSLRPGAAALRSLRVTTQEPAVVLGPEPATATRQLVLDVSDLIQYFHDARLPTGIQRVQIEIITSLLDAPPDDCTLAIACFTQRLDYWVELPTIFFRSLCGLSLRGGDVDGPNWAQALDELRAHLSQTPRLAFRKGAFLINLGTS